MNFFKMVIPFFKLILCSYYCGYNNILYNPLAELNWNDKHK